MFLYAENGDTPLLCLASLCFIFICLLTLVIVSLCLSTKYVAVMYLLYYDLMTNV